MPHRFVDIDKIPGKENLKSSETIAAIVGLADVISAGKAAWVDCGKIGRKPLTVIAIVRKLVKSGELPGIELCVRNRNQDLYMIRRVAA